MNKLYKDYPSNKARRSTALSYQIEGIVKRKKRKGIERVTGIIVNAGLIVLLSAIFTYFILWTTK